MCHVTLNIALEALMIGKHKQRMSIEAENSKLLYLITITSWYLQYNVVVFLCRSSHRDYFENICSFLPRAPFSGVFQEALCVHRTDANFPERFVYSPNRYQFSRSTFLATEQIQIFQEHFFFGYQTDTDFPGTPF